MANQPYLLDTSAVVTFLEDERGADRVEEILRNEQFLVPFPVLLEVYYITLLEQTEDVADKRYAFLKQIPAIFLHEIDEPTLMTAANFKANYPLSLADAMIGAFASQHKAILVHKDPEFESLEALITLESLPYKR